MLRGHGGFLISGLQCASLAIWRDCDPNVTAAFQNPKCHRLVFATRAAGASVCLSACSALFHR
jgi:hypothetical protein